MKRRGFLIASGGVAGELLMRAARGQLPCPAPTVSGRGGATVSTPCVKGVGPNAPAWFTAMADATWTQVAAGAGFGASYQNGTRVQDVLPAVLPSGNPGAICYAWNGGVVDQTRNTLMLANSGGHQDYAGNEIYALNLMTPVPGWVLVQEPTPAAAQSSIPQYPSNASAAWADGNPASTHNYQRLACNGNYLCLPGIDATWNAMWTTQCWLYNLTAAYAQQANWPLPNTSGFWSSPGYGLSSIAGGNFDASSGANGLGIWDPVNGLFWGSTDAGVNGAGQGMYSLNPSTGAIKAFAGNGSESAVMCPHLRSPTDPGCIITVSSSSGKLVIIDVANPNAPTLIGNSNITGGLGSINTSSGRAFQSVNNSILYWNGGTSFDKLTIPASNPVTGTYIHSTVGWSGSVSPSAPPAAGTYGRFNIINNMGAPENKAALVILNGISQPTYVLKVPVVGL